MFRNNFALSRNISGLFTVNLLFALIASFFQLTSSPHFFIQPLELPIIVIYSWSCIQSRNLQWDSLYYYSRCRWHWRTRYYQRVWYYLFDVLGSSLTVLHNARFSLKFRKIVADEKEGNFISRLHRGRISIIPWSVCISRRFFALMMLYTQASDQYSPLLQLVRVSEETIRAARRHLH